MVYSVQNNALLLFRSVLALHGLGTRGLLAVSKYRCHLLDALFVGLHFAHFQWSLRSSHRMLGWLNLPPPALCGCECRSNEVLGADTVE